MTLTRRCVARPNTDWENALPEKDEVRANGRLMIVMNHQGIWNYSWWTHDCDEPSNECLGVSCTVIDLVLGVLEMQVMQANKSCNPHSASKSPIPFTHNCNLYTYLNSSELMLYATSSTQLPDAASVKNQM